jgi:hypothetical protein
MVSRETYRGNPLLKPSNHQQEWTKEQVDEFIKCANDPVYFVQTYMKIVSVDDGLVPFNMYDYQKEMITSIHENRYTILATARQVGKSVTMCAYILWYIIFNQDKTVAILANRGETAREILGRVQLAYEKLPKWIQHGVVEFNKGSFELENNSRVLAAASSSSSIRGYSINLLMIDEAAFVPNFDEFFTSVFPTISSGKTTKAVLVSTPNGLNSFYKLYRDSINGNNDYKAITVTWDKVPGRDEKWKEETIRSLGGDLQRFSQEHCVEFLGSSSTLVSGWKLKELAYETPLHDKEGLKIYEQPTGNHVYSIIADVSRGKGLDYSAFQVIDITEMPYKQVATFRSNMITPSDYSDIIAHMGRHYNGAYVLVEINDIGGQVSEMLALSHDYENILYTQNKGRLGKILSLWGDPYKSDAGIRTTPAVKREGCSILKLLVEQNQLILQDFDTINELSRFSKKGASYEAEPGSHDDLVMGLVLFAWFSTQKGFTEMTDHDTMMRLRDKSEDEIRENLLPLGIIDDGMTITGDDDTTGWTAVDGPNDDTMFSGWIKY